MLFFYFKIKQATIYEGKMRRNKAAYIWLNSVFFDNCLLIGLENGQNLV